MKIKAERKNPVTKESYIAFDIRRLATKIICLAFVLTLAVLLSIPAFASSELGEQGHIIDEAGVLTSSRISTLEAQLAAASENTGINILVGLYVSPNIPNGVEVVRDFGLDPASDDIALLIIEIGEQPYLVNYYELFTWGIADTVITDSSANEILDHADIYDGIKFDRDYTKAITAYASLVEKSIKSFRTTLVVCLIILSLAVGGGAVGFVVYRYKKKLKSPIYPTSDYADLNLQESTDVFLGSSVTRTKISSSSSSGGGRSGGGGGGSRGRR